MEEEIELLEVQDIPAEEGAGVDAENAEHVVMDVGSGSPVTRAGATLHPRMQRPPIRPNRRRNKGSVSIDFRWLRSMEEKLASTYGPNSSPSLTICRVPAIIRECDRSAYNPKIVSIGPFHRGRKNLQAMEEHKWRCLHEVLAFGGRRYNLKKFLKEMKAIETRARICYSDDIQMSSKQFVEMSSKEFVEMMLLDGCFIILLILQQSGICETDVLIFDNEWMLRLILIDMLLLENQLPFFVLECLWELIVPPGPKLREEALASYWFFSYDLELESPQHVIHHLLHLVHLSLEPDSPTREPQTTSASGKLSSLRLCQRIGKTLDFLCPKSLINTCDRCRTPTQQSSSKSKNESPQLWKMIPSATELQEAGVRFQLKKARSFFEVRFEQGLMEMPCLCIYDSTNTLFRNLIALEQCFPKCGNHFTSYCHFIDFLVDTPRDVSILREAGIITNGLGSNEEVALFFNKLCKQIAWNVEGSYLADLFQKVDQHTKKRCPRWRAKLVRDYFGSPWAIISLIAAVIILILTFLQTNFSVFAYFKPPKP